jgi:hypothetical protein
MNTYGNGALTLSDGDGKHNLYQLYEKEYFRMINLLLSCDYTVVFIGHEQVKNDFITPKGDKRCLNPIIDNCDFVVYVHGNGIDENGKEIPSSGYFVTTNKFFARSRFTECVPKIDVFSAENLQEAVKKAVLDTAKKDGSMVVSYDEQKDKNTNIEENFEDVMTQIKDLGQKLAENGYGQDLQDIIEETLGAGQRVMNCTKRQIDAVLIIRDDLKNKIEELGL